MIGASVTRSRTVLTIRVLDAPFTEFIGWQYTRPSVENLYCIDFLPQTAGLSSSPRPRHEYVDQFRENYQETDMQKVVQESWSTVPRPAIIYVAKVHGAPQKPNSAATGRRFCLTRVIAS